MKKVWLILCAVILLIGSTLLDLLFKRFQTIYVLMKPIIPFGAEMAAYVILMILLLLFAWVVLYRNSRSTVIICVFIILGAAMMFFMTIPGNGFLFSTIAVFIPKTNKFLPIVDLLTDIVTSRYGFTRITAAVVLAIGLLRLLPDKKLWTEKKH